MFDRAARTFFSFAETVSLCNCFLLYLSKAFCKKDSSGGTCKSIMDDPFLCHQSAEPYRHAWRWRFGNCLRFLGACNLRPGCRKLRVGRLADNACRCTAASANTPLFGVKITAFGLPPSARMVSERTSRLSISGASARVVDAKIENAVMLRSRLQLKIGWLE